MFQLKAYIYYYYYQTYKKNEIIAENNISFLNLVPYKNEQTLSLNLFNEKSSSIQLICTILISSNIDNISLFAEYVQLSGGTYVNTEGIHLPGDYKQLKGLCDYLQPYYYKTVKDEGLTPKPKINTHTNSVDFVGEVTVVESNISLPMQLILRIQSDYIILADLYDNSIREISYDLLRVVAVGNLITLISPSIQVQFKTFKASEYRKQIDLLIDTHHGSRDFEIFAENTDHVINFGKAIASLDRGHKSVEISVASTPTSAPLNKSPLRNNIKLRKPPQLSDCESPPSPTSESEFKIDVY